MAQLLWVCRQGRLWNFGDFLFYVLYEYTICMCSRNFHSPFLCLSTHFRNFTKAYICDYNLYQGNACWGILLNMIYQII